MIMIPEIVLNILIFVLSAMGFEPVADQLTQLFVKKIIS